jgi:hypothetical protein
VRWGKGWSLLVGALLIVTDIVLLAANVFGIRLFGGSYSIKEGGTFAEWVAAVGTVGALFATLGAFIWQRRQSDATLEAALGQLRLSSEEAAARESERRASQAVLVSAWLVPRPAGSLSSDAQSAVASLQKTFQQVRARHRADCAELGLRDVGTTRALSSEEYDALTPSDKEFVSAGYLSLMRWISRYGQEGPAVANISVIRIRNGGASPVYAFAAQIIHGSARYSLHVPLVPPMEVAADFEFATPEGKFLILAPNSDGLLGDGASLSIAFTDSAGVKWSRSETGQLVALGVVSH